MWAVKASSGLPTRNESLFMTTGGINTMNFPVDDFIGGRMGGSSSNVEGVTTSQHRIVVFLLIAVVGYTLWHYAQTH